MVIIKDFLKYLRDAVAYSFAWLVICVIAVALITRNDVITVFFLVKLFCLCLWGSISFTLCFRNKRLEKRGFIFLLTLFYILFIPVEILMFYLMGIFLKTGSAGLWLIFLGIIVVMYIISVLIDKVVMKKKAEIYTKKLMDYSLEHGTE